MYHLVYTSHAIIPFSQADLIQLLEKCRNYNKENKISGMLLYLGGKFIQVLEGNKEKVETLYEKIRKDPAHNRIMTVIEGNAPSRIFKDWSMGFKQLSYSAFSNLTGYQDIDLFFNPETLNEEGHLLLVFLKLFYKQNIVDYAEL